MQAHREYHEKLMRVVAEDEAAPPPDDDSANISFTSAFEKTAKTDKNGLFDKNDAPFSSREPSIDLRNAEWLAEAADKPDNLAANLRILPL